MPNLILVRATTSLKPQSLPRAGYKTKDCGWVCYGMTRLSVPTCYFINWGLIIDRLVFVQPPAGHAHNDYGTCLGACRTPGGSFLCRVHFHSLWGAHSLELRRLERGRPAGWGLVSSQVSWQQQWRMPLICVSSHPHNNPEAGIWSPCPSRSQARQGHECAAWPLGWGLREGPNKGLTPSPAQTSCLRARRVFPGAAGRRGIPTVQAGLPRPGGFT